MLNTSFTFPLEQSNISPGFQARVEQQSDLVVPEIIRLRTTNDLWKMYSPEWDMYVKSYEGGPDFANIAYIFKHQRENQADFEDRGKRLHYFNYCEPLVDFFTNFIFTETIQRSGGPDDAWYQDFISDVNRKGDSVTDYMKQVSDDMQIFGMSWTLVDLPELNLAEGEILTEQAVEDLGHRPYWVLIKPDEMIDWLTDDFDNLLYAKRKQINTIFIAGRGPVKIEKYVEWTTEDTTVTRVDISNEFKPQIIDTKVYLNTIGMIPLTVTRYKRSKRHLFMGNSFLRDFAYNGREVMNYTSLLQEFLNKQCFNMLAKESDTGIPMRDQNDGISGTANVIEYPKGGTAPAYISPPTTPAEFIRSERALIVESMFKRACQDTASELSNGEGASGFSQAQSFSKTVPFISSRADTLEKSENAFMWLTMKMLQKKWNGKIKYKDRYELTNITDAISQLTSIFRDLMMPSETFVKEELKLLVSEMDGKLPPDVLAKIKKEIDGMDYKDFVETQKLALVGNAGQSPAAQEKPKSTGTMAEVAKESTGKTGATTKAKPRTQKRK